MSDGFYRAFENRFRGSRELIKDRLRVYLPFLEPLRAFYPDLSVIDLGCGRGEWLELLREKHIQGRGVDLDERMLDACQALGLAARRADAIETLKALPDESQVVVSGFHIAEHLPFDWLQTLVGESLRVLKPGGLLLLETPNPENIVVSTVSFHLDPTHRSPIPPQLLSFLAEHLGFSRVKTLRLQESKETAEREFPTLGDVFNGASPDYALLAQKHSDDEIFNAIDEVAGLDYGVSLASLLSRYDNASGAKFQRLESAARQAEQQAAQATESALRATEKALHAAGNAQQAAESAQQAAVRAALAESQIRAVLASRSWRLTRPLRWLARTVYAMKQRYRRKPRQP